MLAASYILETECSLFWLVLSLIHPIMMLSFFFATEVVLEHKADAPVSSIKMLTFPHFTSSPTHTYKLQGVEGGFFTYRIEELFFIVFIIILTLCVYVCLTYMYLKT